MTKQTGSAHLRSRPAHESDPMRRLYLQVYLTIVASLFLVVITAGMVWHFSAGVLPFEQPFEVAGEVIAELVPPASAPREAQQQAIERLARRLGGDLALFGQSNDPLAAAGRPLPPPNREPGRRLAADRGRAGGVGPAAGRALAGGAGAVRAASERGAPGRVSRLDRACGRARRPADGAPPHRPARAPAARRRVARRRRSARPGQGRRPRRGGAAGAKLQSGRRPHREAWSTPTSCCSPMRRTSCARR